VVSTAGISLSTPTYTANITVAARQTVQRVEPLLPVTLLVVIVPCRLLLLSSHFQMFPISTAKEARSLLALYSSLTRDADHNEQPSIVSSRIIMYHLVHGRVRKRVAMQG
jgi:hypothetical protein